MIHCRRFRSSPSKALLPASKLRQSCISGEILIGGSEHLLCYLVVGLTELESVWKFYCCCGVVQVMIWCFPGQGKDGNLPSDAGQGSPRCPTRTGKDTRVGFRYLVIIWRALLITSQSSAFLTCRPLPTAFTWPSP